MKDRGTEPYLSWVNQKDQKDTNFLFIQLYTVSYIITYEKHRMLFD